MFYRSRRVSAAVGALLLMVLYVLHRSPSVDPVQRNTSGISVDAVVVQLRAEDTRWYRRFFPDFNYKFYVVDDPSAELTVSVNKGRESMAYLSYIIEHYDRLPQVVLFLHASRWQWHNDDPDYDGYGILSRLQIPYIVKEGYVNLRCAWIIGCPAEIRPFHHTGSGNATAAINRAYKQAFEELFPEYKVPKTVAVACCAQFGVSRETILLRPLEDYVRYRQWLINTDIEDAISGRIFEYSWHIMFGKTERYCPEPKDCYCKLFGLCDLVCTEGACEGRYELPMYSTLPGGWPLFDWDGNQRLFAGPLDGRYWP